MAIVVMLPARHVDGDPAPGPVDLPSGLLGHQRRVVRFGTRIATGVFRQRSSAEGAYGGGGRFGEIHAGWQAPVPGQAISWVR